MSKPSKVQTRKLLVAAVGVASVSYVACTSSTTSGNLVPPPGDASMDAAPDTANEAAADIFIGSGNLVAPLADASAPDGTGVDTGADVGGQDVQGHDAQGQDAQRDALVDVFIGSGNLVAPLPDAGLE